MRIGKPNKANSLKRTQVLKDYGKVRTDSRIDWQFAIFFILTFFIVILALLKLITS
jgi:hypothetical protein